MYMGRLALLLASNSHFPTWAELQQTASFLSLFDLLTSVLQQQSHVCCPWSSFSLEGENIWHFSLRVSYESSFCFCTGLTFKNFWHGNFVLCCQTFLPPLALFNHKTLCLSLSWKLTQKNLSQLHGLDTTRWSARCRNKVTKKKEQGEKNLLFYKFFVVPSTESLISLGQHCSFTGGDTFHGNSVKVLPYMLKYVVFLCLKSFGFEGDDLNPSVTFLSFCCPCKMKAMNIFPFCQLPDYWQGIHIFWYHYSPKRTHVKIERLFFR